MEDENNYDLLQEKTTMIVGEMTQQSMFFALNPPQPMPLFELDEIQTGRILGEGQFCTVREVTRISSEQLDLKPLIESATKIGFMSHHSEGVISDSGESATTSQSETITSHIMDHPDYALDESNRLGMNSFFARNASHHIIAKKRSRLQSKCWRHGKARYAVKQIRSDLIGPTQIAGVIDLATEAKLLASLQHPNIVRLRGTVGVAGRPDFMLLLDRLHTTMVDKLKQWKIEQRGLKLRAFGLPFSRQQIKYEAQEFLIDRLLTAFDVARVFKHLHHHNIIYRDLKPENVGYDIRDDLRIFDFGLAREVSKHCLEKEPEDYLCTGMTGSRRWMAPEVYLHKPYGPSADVYSFGLLLWNIFALKTPFGRTNLDKHFNEVIKGGKRPPKLPSHAIPSSLNKMMEKCWSHDRPMRPTFEVITSTIRSELNQLHQMDMFITTNRTLHLESLSDCSA